MSDTSHVAGATSKIVTLRAYVVSTGLPYTAGVFNTSGIDAKYTRDGGTATAITLVTATAGTWTSSGFVHRGKGVYELGLPNAALVAGVDGVEVAIDGITDVVFIPVRVEILGTDPRSSTAPNVNVTAIAGQTASAAAGVTFPASIAAVGSAMTLTTGERTSIASAVEAAILNEGDGSAVQQAIVDKINATDTNLAGLTLSAIAQAVRDVAIAGAAGGSFGALVNSIYARLGAPAGASMSADIALLLTDLLLVKAKTDNLPASPAAVSDIPTAVQNADALLGRSQQGGSNTAPHVADALAGGLMKFTINPGTGVLTVLNGDGSTAYTRTLSRSALDAIVGSS